MSRNRQKRRGFSLTELLFALGVLSIGMIFVAGVFPTGIMFTIESTEQTIATVVADEAFAKVRLLAWDPTNPIRRVEPNDFEVDQLSSFDILLIQKRPFSEMPFLLDEFSYPSSFDVEPVDRNYYWSALCRQLRDDPDSPVQVTVFVSRRTGEGTLYRHPIDPLNGQPVDRPMPVYVNAVLNNLREIEITEPAMESFVFDGAVIVGNISGSIGRVLRREGLVLTLTEDWRGVDEGIWVVPPPINGGRNPCIAVHQRVIKF